MGKENILQFLKNGSGIHIKKENRGKFTDYCKGKVTSECIARGKRSSNPAIRKRATFAANARKWKHLEGGTLTYEQWQLMVPELKMAYNKNIAKSFLSSPTLSNLYNSVKAYFGGYAPKNPYLQTGIAPSPGMSSKALALLGKMKNAYNVERLLSKKSMLSGIRIPVETIKDAIKTGDVPLVSTKIVEPIEEAGLTIRKIKPIMLENYVSNPAERAAMLDFKAANPNVYVGKTKMLIGRPSLESYKEIMYPEAYEELVRKLGYKKQGGKVKKKHLAFVNGVSILDSNPDAYKYVKKKLHKAANGGNTGNWLSGVGNFINKNLNTISNIAGTAVNGISSIVGSILKLKSANDLIKANNLKNLVSLEELIAKYLQEEMERLQKEEGQYPGINSSPIVNNYVAYLRALLKALAEIANLKNLTAEENAKILQEALSDLTNSIMGTVGNLAGIGLLSNKAPFRKNFTPKA